MNTPSDSSCEHASAQLTWRTQSSTKRARAHHSLLLLTPITYSYYLLSPLTLTTHYLPSPQASEAYVQQSPRADELLRSLGGELLPAIEVPVTRRLHDGYMGAARRYMLVT